MEKVQNSETLNKVDNRKVSKSGTVKSLKGVIVNLKLAGLVNTEDEKKLKEIYQKVVKQWVGEDLF